MGYAFTSCPTATSTNKLVHDVSASFHAESVLEFRDCAAAGSAAETTGYGRDGDAESEPESESESEYESDARAVEAGHGQV